MKSGDSKQLSDLIKILLSDSVYRKKLGKNAKKTVQKIFLGHYSKKTISLFQNLQNY